jgi:beta-glucosidase
MSQTKFPDGFLWGGATSSYQVEGGIENNDWADGAQAGLLPICGECADHYNLYESDFDIAHSLGHNAHRFSIEWARIEPEEGVFDEKEIEHYRKVLKALHARGITPIVTLWHFTLPIWFAKKGGFSHKDSPRIFARYCAYVTEKLGNEAKLWVTINEPLIWANGGYLTGKWPPFVVNPFSFLKVVSTLIRSHKMAYTAIKEKNQDLQVGIAKHNMYFCADSFLWNQVLAKFMVWFWNMRFLKAIDSHQDFVGLNFYITKKFGRKDVFPQTEMGWDINPEGFYQCLIELKRFRKPVYVLENGLADSEDIMRASYITGHVRALKRAIDSGLDVRGYMHWSLLDNFEWSFGFSRRFGLVEIDYNTQTRTVRNSAYVYKEIIEKSIL